MAISELLVQSVGDIIRIFPALSPDCKTSFTDIRAQGGFLISAEGSSVNVLKLTIKSPYGGRLRLLSPWLKIEACENGEQNYLPLTPDQNGVITIETEIDDTWNFRSL